ncbi:MAG TPA: HEAT repeat domain-containing protein [Planktothrix sp.]|jgi:hypothetical protein
MIGKMVDGLKNFFPSKNKATYFFGGSTGNRATARPPSPGVAIGVNWTSEQEAAPITDLVSDTAKLRAIEQYIQNNAHGFIAAENTGINEVSEKKEEREVKDRMIEIIDKLRDGLQWTVVECQGNEWYIPVKESLDPLLEATMTGWAIRAAESKDTPARLLEQLALNEDVEVRIAVADNPNTPTDLVSALARDDSADVRYAIAENHNLSKDVLALLREDDNPYVADRARRTLERLDSGELVRRKFDGRQVKIKAV